MINMFGSIYILALFINSAAPFISNIRVEILNLILLTQFLKYISCIFICRAQVQENIDMIRLQREVKEKSSKLEQMQARYADLEDVSFETHYYCLLFMNFS